MNTFRAKVTIIFLITVLLTSACSSAAAPTPGEPPAAASTAPAAQPAAGEIQPASEIVIYHWTEYIDPQIYTLFEEKTGIKLIEDNFSSNEEMLAKLQGGANGYALIIPSDYTVRIMIEEKLLAVLEQQNIPNLANLSATFSQPGF